MQCLESFSTFSQAIEKNLSKVKIFGKQIFQRFRYILQSLLDGKPGNTAKTDNNWIFEY